MEAVCRGVTLESDEAGAQIPDPILQIGLGERVPQVQSEISGFGFELRLRPISREGS